MEEDGFKRHVAGLHDEFVPRFRVRCAGVRSRVAGAARSRGRYVIKAEILKTDPPTPRLRADENAEMKMTVAGVTVCYSGASWVCVGLCVGKGMEAHFTGG